MASKVKGRKGKLGKNKHRIAAYYMSGRHAFNKLRRVLRHLRAHGEDEVAQATAKALHAALPQAMARLLRGAP